MAIIWTAVDKIQCIIRLCKNKRSTPARGPGSPVGCSRKDFKGAFKMLEVAACSEGEFKKSSGAALCQKALEPATNCLAVASCSSTRTVLLA